MKPFDKIKLSVQSITDSLCRISINKYPKRRYYHLSQYYRESKEQIFTIKTINIVLAVLPESDDFIEFIIILTKSGISKTGSEIAMLLETLLIYIGIKNSFLSTISS
jgi:hypothetical protein